ncbi:OstA-like protein [Roseivirga pacifica]|uniref:OstA-like protein n=1 Tax=Roseivirga pacifica TaxID=1267423 RepID=UPI003BAAEDB3
MGQKYYNSLILALQRMKRTFFTIFLLSLALAIQGQTAVTIKEADKLAQQLVNGKPIQKLIGSVWLIQGNTNIYCDSAYVDKVTNSAKAFGHVKIIDTVDSLDIKGDYLEYDGNTRLAKFRDNVVLKDSAGTLYTDILDYDRVLQVGTYREGGKLVDTENTLTSNLGKYFSQTKKAEFFDSVRLENPDFFLKTDTLYYSSLTTRSRTYGPTEGYSTEGDTLATQKGLLYISEKSYSEVYEGKMVSIDYDIEGDTLIIDDVKKYYTAHQNVVMTSKPDSMTIFGEKGYYDKIKEDALVHTNAYLRKMVQGDSLFISADSLYSKQKEDTLGKYLLAYHDVKLFKSDLQGIADSVSYNFTDSTIYMYQDPVIWSQDSQISADSINILVKNNKIDRMDLAVSSFVIQQDSLKNFNQIKGRDMQVHFKDGMIQRTDVFGNGESIYYIVDELGATSMNKTKCSNLAIYFENSFVSELRTYREVDGRVIPSFEILNPERTLRGFSWRMSEKPKLEDVARHLRYDK